MGETMQFENLTVFLDACKESGNMAYAKFKDLLEKLEDPTTRSAARRFLTDVEQFIKEDCKDADPMQKYNFDIHQLSLSDLEEGVEGYEPKRQTLTLLEMSSIFTPEDWSFTFYEGISRHPDTGFRDRDVTELGCGNGWISIALADRWSPRKVYGLDINPRAIKVAWINLYLNALHPDGTLIVDQEGKSLLDRVEFYVSDLLETIREKKILLDRVVGCIPQVLSPDPETALKIVSEAMSEEFLYSLSNYCSLQGFVEDQFGLGLIARAVEEAIEVVKPHGAVILNMGGRPGQAVCERLFQRRGFHIKKLWQTKVNQAADTDILPLVEIEKSSRHRFEFFMGQACEERISARTAYAYAKSGGTISHGLTVYEGRLQHPLHVKAIFRFLAQEGYHETRSALDLFFADQAVADEKLAFLAHLARTLESKAHFPYEPPAGNERFRQQISGFLRLYFRIPLSAANLVILPSRAVAINSLLELYAPPLALVASSLTRYLPRKWLSALPSEKGPVVLEAPHRTELVVRLAKALKPQLMIITLADFEMRTPTAFELLLETSAEVGARLFLDISEYLELSSLPGTNGVLQYLAEKPLPSHAAIICGLVKNQVYSDLEACFMVSESKDLLTSLANNGELTYSRTASTPQLYYGCLLHELLSFQIPDKHALPKRPLQAEDASTKDRFVSVNASAAEAFQHPAIATIHLPEIQDDDVIRMDYGENCLPSPAAMKQFVFEGFGRQNISEAEMDPRPEILQLLADRFGLLSSAVADVVVCDGAASLFARLMAACAEERGTLLYPAGSNGTFLATAKSCGVETKMVQTDRTNSFKLTKEKLSASLDGVARPWLVLSAPVVNPTGAIYSTSEIYQLLDTCRAQGVLVVLDTCFSGLEFGEGPERGQLEALARGGRCAILGEVAKEFSAGGLGFGYAAVTDGALADMLRELASGSKPHGTLRYAVKRILTLLHQGSRPLVDELAAQRQLLKERANQLVKVLSETGWEPLEPEGGLFVVARPTAYEGHSVAIKESPLGKSHAATSSPGQPSAHPPGLANGDLASVQRSSAIERVDLSSENIADVLFLKSRLVVNNSHWTSLPGYCRFVISQEDGRFLEGLRRLKEFHSLVFGSNSS